MHWDLARLSDECDAQLRAIRAQRVAPAIARGDVARELERRYPFDGPHGIGEVAADVIALLERGNLHTAHPRYFGLFNPGVRFSSVVADLISASINPQIGAWFHSPAGVEIEEHTLRFLLRAFGFDPRTSAAHFTSGGSEANLTATLAAFGSVYPETRRQGVRGLDRQPVLLVSSEAHHAFFKIARHMGLGDEAVRTVPADGRFRMRVDALREAVERDKPFMVVATAGTTAGGAIDPLEEVAGVCAEHGIWLHVDAAWGGAAILSPRLKQHLKGIEHADSITCDAHKWLGVAMGAGMFFTRRPEALAAFEIDASYVPRGDELDLYRSSLQWSRRFIGLKLFLALAELGADGIAKQLDHQAAMADLLRDGLRNEGWEIVNDSPFPLVCFRREGVDVAELVRRIVAGGDHWISHAVLGGGIGVARACITNHETAEEDVASLLRALRGEKVNGQSGGDADRNPAEE
ncbi:MAG TPA: aminotransferase class V-fold PLP-dependent enzyme [Thermoanaerobaculia bacterium]